jgi:hypothetical protein
MTIGRGEEPMKKKGIFRLQKLKNWLAKIRVSYHNWRVSRAWQLKN